MDFDLVEYLRELEILLSRLRVSDEPSDDRMEELRQRYETVCTLLEGHFLDALMSGNWEEFDEFVSSFKELPSKHQKTSADELTTHSAGSSQNS